jgi:hypothetical protein
MRSSTFHRPHAALHKRPHRPAAGRPAAAPAARRAAAPGPELAAPALPPAVETRRSARLVGNPQRSHVISFPGITDTEGDEDEEDGLEYDFHWHADEF